MVVPKIYMGVRLMRLKKSFLKVYPMRMFLIPVFTICFFMQTAQAEQERMEGERTLSIAETRKMLQERLLLQN